MPSVQTKSPIQTDPNNLNQYGGKTSIFTPLYNGVSYVNHHIIFIL